jgi:hypothetical protein
MEEITTVKIPKRLLPKLHTTKGLFEARLERKVSTGETVVFACALANEILYIDLLDKMGASIDEEERKKLGETRALFNSLLMKVIWEDKM